VAVGRGVGDGEAVRLAAGVGAGAEGGAVQAEASTRNKANRQKKCFIGLILPVLGMEGGGIWGIVDERRQSFALMV
jgi:hypothetical protein